MRSLLSCGILAVLLSFAGATTLQQLSLDDMIRQSTAIVRGKVQLTGASMRGGYIYTNYTVQVVEQFKGTPALQMNFVVPGGTVDGVRQTIAGAPAPVTGQEYVLYLWTSRSGLTQVIGLSQGLFVSANGMLTRPAITDHIVSSSGSAAGAPQLEMTLPAMRNQIASVLKGRPVVQ